MVPTGRVQSPPQNRLGVGTLPTATLNTVSKSAIFEFSGGGGGGTLPDPTLNTVSKSDYI